MVRNSRAGLGLIVGLVLAAAAPSAQDAAAVIGGASKALGVDTLKTVQYSATGFDFALGQAPNPSSPWPKFINKTYTRAIDFKTPASKVDRVRMQGENPPRGGGLQPVIGEQPQSQTIIIGPTTPWVQQLEIWMMPHAFVKAAAAKNATVKSQTVAGKRYSVVTFTGDNKALVNGYINDQHLIDKVETWIDSPYLGDMLFESSYSNYRDFNGVKFPMKIVQKQGDYPIFDLTVSDVKVNAPVAITAPQGRGGPPAGAAPAAAAGVPTEKLADGVFLILGGYAAVAVDFKDYIVVIEGPQSEARATQIITEAKKLIPGKPIRYVVNTHPHSDHTGGLPALVAQGATIVTQKNNEKFLQGALNTPRTLLDDVLAKNPKKARIETVSEKKVYSDGTRSVELYHIYPAPHSNGLLVAYIPKEKILFQGDFSVTPGQPANDHVKALVPALEKLNLVDFDRYINVHAPAAPQTKADVWKAVGKT